MDHTDDDRDFAAETDDLLAQIGKASELVERAQALLDEADRIFAASHQCLSRLRWQVKPN
jgi:hypothetical protein